LKAASEQMNQLRLPPRACLRKDGAEMSAGGIVGDAQPIGGIECLFCMPTEQDFASMDRTIQS
jgi:hypothetical protein